MKKITLKGSGQLNGSVVIDKTLELEDNIANKLNGADKAEVLKSLMDIHYPGVKFNPNQIGINISNIEKKGKTAKKNMLLDAAVAASSVSLTKKKNNSKNKKSNASEFRSEIEHLLKIKFSPNKTELENNLDEIFITLKSYKWPLRSDGGEINENNTRILNQVYEKYKIGYRKLKSSVSNQDEIIPHIKQFKKLRRKKIFNQHGLWIYTILTITFLVLFIIIAKIFRL